MSETKTIIRDADLAQLRGEVRTLRTIVGILAAGCLVSWLLGASESAPTVETKELLLRDPNGNVRARLEMERLGPRLALLSGTGVVVLELGIVDGALGIADSIEEDGTERSVRVRDIESSYLKIYDGLGNARLSFHVGRHPDRATISISDASGRTIWAEPKTSAGKGVLSEDAVK